MQGLSCAKYVVLLKGLLNNIIGDKKDRKHTTCPMVLYFLSAEMKSCRSKFMFPIDHDELPGLGEKYHSNHNPSKKDISITVDGNNVDNDIFDSVAGMVKGQVVLSLIKNVVFKKLVS